MSQPAGAWAVRANGSFGGELARGQRKRGCRFLGNPLAFFLVELEGIEPTTS